MTNATVKMIATWLESNQHRFIFFIYNTGAGGEFIHSYLGKQPDVLFYRHYEKSNAPIHYPTNRTTMFIPNISKGIQEYLRIQSDIDTHTFESIAEDLIKITAHPITIADITAFEKLPGRIMLLAHETSHWMTLFRKSKIIFYSGGEYDNYIEILGTLKCLDDGDGPWAKFKKYNPPSSNLRQDLINAIIYDGWQREVKNVYSEEVVVQEDWLVRGNRHFLDANKRLKNYNIRFVDFCDSFNGTWINDEFGIDSNEFNKAMIEWDKDNTTFLRTYCSGIVPKFIGKQPNRYLYNV